MKEQGASQGYKNRHRLIREAMLMLRSGSLNPQQQCRQHDGHIVFEHNGHRKQEDEVHEMTRLVHNGHRKAPELDRDLLARSPAGKAAWELKKKRKPVRLGVSPFEQAT